MIVRRKCKKDLLKFLMYYILYRRHGSLRKELNIKTPVDAIEKCLKLNLKFLKKIQYSLKIKFYLCL